MTRPSTMRSSPPAYTALTRRTRTRTHLDAADEAAENDDVTVDDALLAAGVHGVHATTDDPRAELHRRLETHSSR